MYEVVYVVVERPVQSKAEEGGTSHARFLQSRLAKVATFPLSYHGGTEASDL